MDQNAIKITKLHYRNSILASIAATNSKLLDSMKKITLRRAINLLDAAWSRVSEVTLANCWKNILNFTADDDDPEDSVPLAVLKEKWGAEIRALLSNTVDLLNSLNAEAELTLPGVHDWNEDIEDDNANDEHEEDDDSDEGSVSEVEEKIMRTEAVEIFNKAIRWAGHENVDPNDVNVLRHLREKAVLQPLETHKIQKRITDFFK
ncbi:tigger transposable element-derived protein 6-like [Zeugodacus cucurbitae]|uniref:tigger transposable element-derived protein 6-like n=1 Tax=Zeugodacus cucurbitae TaxID=28588 RepID=UPI0023D8F6D3|nr:tigger transposable element-derived protein 6-like [Zeugodacus cucurbitae]